MWPRHLLVHSVTLAGALGCNIIIGYGDLEPTVGEETPLGGGGGTASGTGGNDAVHTLGGTVLGLQGELVIANDTQELEIVSDGPFVFPAPLPDGLAYTVEVREHPLDRFCGVQNGSGTIAGAAVSSVLLRCIDAMPTYVKASNNAAGARFGSAVAISGDTLVVTATGDDSGVIGDETDVSRENSGAAFVFVKSGNIWTQQAYLKASNIGAGDQFGSAVAISGDTLVVGARFEDSNATTVNGDGTNDDLSHSGAAYVFTRSGATWAEQAYLKAANANAEDRFGGQVSIDGDTIVVGARREDSNATGVNGVAQNNQAVDSGAAYVFVRAGTSWTQQAYLKASNTGTGDFFGSAVGVSGDTVVVGAAGEGSSATGVGGQEANNGAMLSGAAYVFVRDDTIWTQEAYVKAPASGAGDGFGAALALDGDTLVVGAPGDSEGGLPKRGAAHVYTRSDTAWSFVETLLAENATVDDQLGTSVALFGDTIVVGAAGEDSSGRGAGGDESDDATLGSGAAYLFTRVDGAWLPLSLLKASNTGGGDAFGWSVAVGELSWAVSTIDEDSAAIGIGASGDDDDAPGSGAVYVFE